jgi:hypothetical protein
MISTKWIPPHPQMMTLGNVGLKLGEMKNKTHKGSAKGM